jgi:hypothetical protein
MEAEEILLAQRRNGAKAQRKTIRNAAALCAFAPLREKYPRYKYSLDKAA